MTQNTDSAGRPWEGRNFHHHDTAYADDDGSMPASFEAAMLALHDGSGSLGEVVASLREQRLLVPLLAEAGELAEHDGKLVDKSQELSIVSVSGPDGAAILPMFSNVVAMQQWQAKARPVPVGIDRAVAAALEDGAARIVVDPASWSEIVLTRPMLEALLTGAKFVPFLDAAVPRQRLLDPLLALPGVLGVVLSPGDPMSRLLGDEVQAVIVTVAGARDDAFDAALQRAIAQVQGDDVVRQRLTGLGLRLREVEPAAELRIEVAEGAELYTRT